MKILITGKNGIAASLARVYSSDHDVILASRSNMLDIDNIKTWGHQFADVDIVFNCAYSNWSQIDVLDFFAEIWKNNKNKTIVNIGSKVTDYSRIEREIDREYFPYRLHKQTLQLASASLSENCLCRVVLINPGAVDTDLIKHLTDVQKMDPDYLAKRIQELLLIPEIRRVDLWE